MSYEARAVVIREAGGPEVLELGSVRVPAPGWGQVGVEVVAAGLNRADVLQRRGLYPAPAGVAADVPGLEYAGHVCELGPGVRSVEVGDRVMGIVAGGGQATRVCVDARELIPVPASLSLERAAAIPEAFLTAYDALFLQAGLMVGDRVLVHAIGSGVGTAALQLAVHAGARVLGTSRTPDKLARCAELAAFEAIHVQGGQFAREVQRLVGGADVILDLVGGAYLEENLRAMADRARMIVIGLLGGATASLPLARLLRRRAQITGSVLRSRPPEERADLARAFVEKVVPLFSSGALTPVVQAVVPMSRVADAHRQMERDETFGKLVLSWS